MKDQTESSHARQVTARALKNKEQITLVLGSICIMLQVAKV
jgi:hypothetical protein